MGAHRGRCFRVINKLRRAARERGEIFFACPTRTKVPLELKPFLPGPGNSRQRRAGKEEMFRAIQKHTQFMEMKKRIEAAIKEAQEQAAEKRVAEGSSP
jgi:hypothetical protein